MKYRILTDQTKIINGHTLYRIQRISDDKLGGWIESEHNLSQAGDCWVDGEACVYENARVYEDARVYDDARVASSAEIYGQARVSGVVGVAGYAKVFGNARVFEMANIYSSAQIYGWAWIYGLANIGGDAHVYDSATVCGSANVLGAAQVCGHVHLDTGEFRSDCRTDHAAVIRCGILDVVFVDGKITLYKRVNRTKNPNVWVSCYDPNFKYYKGRGRAVKNPDLRWEASCASGLHLSRANYPASGDVIIACEVEFKDIICVQEGKVRCRRIAKVLGEAQL